MQKIKLLQKLKDQAEILICVYAGDIERNKIRGDYGITYDMDILRLIDELRGYGLLSQQCRYHSAIVDSMPRKSLSIN